MVIFTVIIIGLFYAIKKILKLHRNIDGAWLTYIFNWILLKRYAKQRPHDRLSLHNIYSNELEHFGHVPFQEEYNYALPKKNQTEQLFILAANTGEKARLEVNLIRRPLCQTESEYDNYEPLKDNVTLEMNYHDSDGVEYYINQTDILPFNDKEYRAFGFAFEPTQATKYGRIKFRGYLRRRTDNRLVYVRMRLLCTSFAITLDHSYVRNPCFMNREMMNERSLNNSVTDIESILDDRQEQWSHLRGTIQIEQDPLYDMHFIATVGRRMYKIASAIEKIHHLWGYSRAGFGFYLGVVQLTSGKSYRYGVMNHRNQKFQALKDCSLQSGELLKYLQNTQNCPEIVSKFVEDKLSIRLGENHDIKINDDPGTYFISVFSDLPKSGRNPDQKANEYVPENDLIVSLKNKKAKLVPLSGGKGASLAQLYHLSGEGSSKFVVPNAIIVTSEAYKKQTENNAKFCELLKNVQNVAYDPASDEKQKLAMLKIECEKLQKWFEEQELLSEIKAEIEKNMLTEFGADSERLFAVRSSASTEDSEEMSTAGQMSTLLGVRADVEKLSKAVMKCWASQFGFVAIEYKRGYGQNLDSPMAVVIQEMVDSQSAGVVFTAHPNNGDERFMTITSNFGLGESVVSAAADPDTFEVEIDVTESRKRKAVKVVKERIGSKMTVTRITKKGDDEIENVENEKNDELSNKSSLTEDMILLLANCCLEIQAHYGNARDIEWGIVNGQLYIFQSRPITNLDSGLTDYELMHEIDSPHDSETEVYSRAHWGENFPGSGSIAGSMFFQSPTVMGRQMVMQGILKLKDFNVFKPPMGFVSQQLMFNMRFGMFTNMFKDYPKSTMASSQVMAFFGRHLTDNEKIMQVFKENDKLTKRNNSFVKEWIIMPIFYIYMIFFAQRALPRLEANVFKEWDGKALRMVKRVPLKEKYRFAASLGAERMKDVKFHGFLSMASGLKAIILQYFLSWSSKDKGSLQNDFNLLMGHCNDVVSAEVPNTLRLIAKKINNPGRFRNLKDNEALEELRSGRSGEEAKKIFEEFLVKHGHRGYREFDPYYKPWGWDPLPCVQVIISLLKGGGSLEPREEIPISELLKQLKNPLYFWQRWILEKWMLQWCRAGAGYRERTKSMMIKLGSDTRAMMWHLAEEMVKAGYLPRIELFFFLKIVEIESLLNGSRDPTIIKNAVQRLRIYPKLNALKFDEFQYGFRMEPKQKKAPMIVLDDSAVKLTGTPVTVGSVKARVCVAETIEEADQIQQGDILITYSTDIGWSPYFPLISGIVTEIGGTISHGAVIAREFGIPCLIAVDDACHVFKTGDWALLDADTGSIVKVKQ